MTPTGSQPSQNSDNEQAILSECSRLDSNRNRAEKWIKRADQFLQRERVVAASVNELLQNASKLQADALVCAIKKDFDGARKHLKDANEDIYAASHDAINAVIGVIGREIKNYAKGFGHANLNNHFRHYQDLSGVFSRTKRHIANPPQNLERRHDLYCSIAEGADFEKLLNYFDELRGSEIAIGASIEKKEKEYRTSLWLSVVSITLAIISLTGTATLVILRILGI